MMLNYYRIATLLVAANLHLQTQEFTDDINFYGGWILNNWDNCNREVVFRLFDDILFKDFEIDAVEAWVAIEKQLNDNEWLWGDYAFDE
jgi:hypothetical protein